MNEQVSQESLPPDEPQVAEFLFGPSITGGGVIYDAHLPLNSKPVNEQVSQRSEAWFKLRLGKVTASRIADMTARTKSGWGASRAKYMYELLLERLNGCPLPSYQSKAMQVGIEREPAARDAYCFVHNCQVEEIGFVTHPTITMAGCSPDGLIGTDGVLEIKCPEPSAHWQTLRTEQIDGDYLKQMQFQLACTGRAWADFVSFNPDFPVPMQFFCKRVLRDDRLIAELEHHTINFLDELERELEWARARFDLRSAA
jgi:putative phage-type endonuclease